MPFPVNSTEWAAWVQAIGSVVAVVVAVAIAVYQHERDVATRRRDRKEEERSAALRAARVSRGLGLKLVEGLGNLSHLSHYSTAVEFEARKLALKQITQWSYPPEVYLLPQVCLESILELRVVAHEAGGVMDAMPPASSAEAWRMRLEPLLRRASGALHELETRIADEYGD